jgi:hypothetical protein
MNKQLKELRKWLNGHPGRQMALANKLGYSTSTTISLWFSRGKIPRKALPMVERILSKTSTVVKLLDSTQSET